MPTASELPLQLPFTGQDLRAAVERRDVRALLDFAVQLRVAGLRVEPQMMADDLLRNGCTWLTDAFGHRVPLHVRVPPVEPRLHPDESTSFRIAA